MKALSHLAVLMLSLFSLFSCESEKVNNLRNTLKENKYWVVSISDNNTANQIFHFEDKLLVVYVEKETGNGFEIKDHYLDSKRRSFNECYTEKIRESYTLSPGVGCDGEIESETVLKLGEVYFDYKNGNITGLRYLRYGTWTWYAFNDVR